MKPIIAANWKMNLTQIEATNLLNDLSSVIESYDFDIILCPSACYLNLLKQELSTVIIGAQNISEFDQGAYTGEISAKMVASCGASTVLLGHSERRHVFGESNQMIQEKLKLCSNYQLKPILCVGETIEQRKNNQVFEVIKDQLSVIEQFEGDYVVAYEPVWAIGTGETATPEVAQEVHKFIREIVGTDIPILYGGSVNAGNVNELLLQQDINGALVGGASLKVSDFSEILKITSMNERIPQ